MSFESTPPPEHVKPLSTWQYLSQPSPAMVLLSSHPSAIEKEETRRPSPQTGQQVSKPLYPKYVALDNVDTQAKPTSISQLALHPS